MLAIQELGQQLLSNSEDMERQMAERFQTQINHLGEKYGRWKMAAVRDLVSNWNLEHLHKNRKLVAGKWGVVFFRETVDNTLAIRWEVILG